MLACKKGSISSQTGAEELMLGDHTHTFGISNRGNSCISLMISSQLLGFRTGSNKSHVSTMCAGTLFTMTNIKNTMMNTSVLT